MNAYVKTIPLICEVLQKFSVSLIFLTVVKVITSWKCLIKRWSDKKVIIIISNKFRCYVSSQIGTSGLKFILKDVP